MNAQLLQTFLRSREPQKVIKGIDLLRAEGSLADLHTLMDLMKSEVAPVRQKAVDTAADLILRNLIQYFGQIQSSVRESLAKLLEKLDPAVINRIAEGLYADDEERRLRAVQVLGLLGKNGKVTQIVAEMVKDKDRKVRATAVHLLGKHSAGKDMSLAAALLNDADARVRANTVEALAEIGNPAAVGLLLRFRKDPSNRIRGNVLKALWSLGNHDVVAELKEMITSSDHLMRATAAWVIGEIGKDNREMIDLAASCAQDENKLVRENVIAAQLKIGGAIAEKYLKYLCEQEEVEEAKKKLKR